MVVYPQKGKCKTIMNNVLWIVYKNGMFAVGSDAASNMHFCPWKLKSVVHASHALNCILKMV